MSAPRTPRYPIRMAASHLLGIRAERLAADLLLRSGWQILARNWRFGHKEIDLIARCGRVVAFVEVKCRSGGRYGSPAEAVTWGKRRDLACAAAGWVARHGTRSDEFRFDVIAVTGPARRPEITHFEDAWRL